MIPGQIGPEGFVRRRWDGPCGSGRATPRTRQSSNDCVSDALCACFEALFLRCFARLEKRDVKNYNLAV